MDRIESAGLTWKAYMESMPSACATADAYPYAVKHNPFVYYNDIRNNASRCQSHVVSFTQLGADLKSASTTPSYSWITPNMCNDMHDCSIATGDAWLSQQIPAILSSPAFTTQNSVLLLTWDEDDFSGNNHVALVAAGPQVGHAKVSSVAYNHYSILSTLESAWNLSALNSNDSSATTMGDLFSGSTPSTGCSGATIAASPSSSQMSGTPIVFTGSAKGCANPLYEFWARWQGINTWQLLQGYSPTATYNWNTTGAGAGTEYIGVWVKDASSSAINDSYVSIPFAVTVASCNSVSIAAAPTSVVNGSGIHVTITGAASGCTKAGPQYEFWLRTATTDWQMVQGYSTKATYDWNTTGAATGSVYMGIWVKNTAQTLVDAFASTRVAVT
jgi:hypothetical protein